MFPAVFEPAFPASERQHFHALDRSATGISPTNTILSFIGYLKCSMFLPPTLTHGIKFLPERLHILSHKAAWLPSVSLKASSM